MEQCEYLEQPNQSKFSPERNYEQVEVRKCLL